MAIYFGKFVETQTMQPLEALYLEGIAACSGIEHKVYINVNTEEVEKLKESIDTRLKLTALPKDINARNKIQYLPERHVLIELLKDDDKIAVMLMTAGYETIRKDPDETTTVNEDDITEL